jgi:fatty acid desaturase
MNSEDPLKKYCFHPLTRRIVRNPWVKSCIFLLMLLGIVALVCGAAAMLGKSLGLAIIIIAAVTVIRYSFYGDK